MKKDVQSNERISSKDANHIFVVEGVRKIGRDKIPELLDSFNLKSPRSRQY